MVAPDQGAASAPAPARAWPGVPLVHAEKTRDTNTGAITGTLVHSDHIGARNFLIVDDICDGGRTFIELAKVLRPLTDGQVKLYVTHGIFSQGSNRCIRRWTASTSPTRSPHRCPPSCRP